MCINRSIISEADNPVITWSTVADIINVLKLADSSSEDLSECEENYSQTDWGAVELEAIQKSRDQEPLHLQQQKKLADLAKKINDSPQGIVIMETEQGDKKENVDSTSPRGPGKEDETNSEEAVDLTEDSGNKSQQNLKLFKQFKWINTQTILSFDN